MDFMAPPEPELTRFAGISKIQRLLECPVCHDVPFPPIYQCIRGHDICKVCRPKLVICPTCMSPFNETRNYSLEKIMYASYYVCPNKEDGCPEEPKGENFDDHLKKCNFIPSSCPYGPRVSNLPCSNQRIKFKLRDVRSHLVSSHASRCFQITLGQSSSGVFTGSPEVRAAQVRSPHLVSIQTTDILQANHLQFVLCTLTANSVIRFGVFHIGSREEAWNYEARLVLQPGTTYAQQFSPMEWRLVVQPFTESRSFGDISVYGHHFTLQELMYIEDYDLHSGLHWHTLGFTIYDRRVDYNRPSTSLRHSHPNPPMIDLTKI